MNRTRLMAVLVVGLTLTLSGRTLAQIRGGTGSGFGGVDLLLHPLVQKELKLDEAQILRGRALAQEMHQRQMAGFSRLEGLSGEERKKVAEEIVIAHSAESAKALGAILNAQQLARFRQIDIQQRGASALTDPPIALALRLTDEQSAKLKPILDRSIYQLREALSTTRGDRRASFEKVQAVRKETDEKAIALLTEVQKEAWKKLIGEPLDLNPPSRPAR